MKLIGYAFKNGRIDFLREENPWAFTRIDQGMKQSQRDRILVDPSQAPVELRSAAVNEVIPPWMEEAETLLKTADSIYLQFKNDVLRFRKAIHDAGKNQEFITLGNQEETDHFAQEHWSRVRYLYAYRRPNAFCFDVTTMITHKTNSKTDTQRLEMPARMDLTDPSGIPKITFDATGHAATVEIVEWRGTVKEGEVGRYAPENRHLEFTVHHVCQPFTFLVEDRREFRNHSYTFSCEKMRKKLERVVKKKLALLEQAHAPSELSDPP
jgi:hypothetical protein